MITVEDAERIVLEHYDYKVSIDSIDDVGHSYIIGVAYPDGRIRDRAPDAIEKQTGKLYTYNIAINIKEYQKAIPIKIRGEFL